VALERDQTPPGPIVTGFAGRGFRLTGHVFPAGLLMTPAEAMPWDAAAMADVSIESLAPILALDAAPEFVLLGTGASLRRASPALVAALDAREIGIEAMDSRAAARAWGLLRAEGRWIAAALLPLDA
jgi:uncharacterized protein